MARGTVALTREQTSAMGLSGMMKSGSESSRANETGMTYKQVLLSPPGMTRQVDNQ